jgi:hypothetical protein
MNKIHQIGLSIFLPIFYNYLYNLSDGYYSINYIDIIDALIVAGLMGTMIIQFYGTYLILEKHGWTKKE